MGFTEFTIDLHTHTVFSDGNNSPYRLKGLPSWCNSDSHSVSSGRIGHNIVDTKIVDEATLIDYIKSDKQPGHVVARIYVTS